ncbi:uncharacterized protein K452DRAFT_311961 [Aplosporella prunicola CBS 121167]|uniref:Uncharacterized protein n=1 Tax=Aplosporella prunicola CBS 121167 TaxID=1176127 RepID=A0A6A6B372_9PEZI|nr:uncharacterized protein K452DRAFT_311961 [Aplosporella prunicola CBS 121167]KAF2137823.1 hypothetical protein K452DRAFT_311961 [Aplosporella prunicola CBS 121167]
MATAIKFLSPHVADNHGVVPYPDRACGDRVQSHSLTDKGQMLEFVVAYSIIFAVVPVSGFYYIGNETCRRIDRCIPLSLYAKFSPLKLYSKLDNYDMYIIPERSEQLIKAHIIEHLSAPGYPAQRYPDETFSACDKHRDNTVGPVPRHPQHLNSSHFADSASPNLTARNTVAAKANLADCDTVVLAACRVVFERSQPTIPVAMRPFFPGTSFYNHTRWTPDTHISFQASSPRAYAQPWPTAAIEPVNGVLRRRQPPLPLPRPQGAVPQRARAADKIRITNVSAQQLRPQQYSEPSTFEDAIVLAPENSRATFSILPEALIATIRIALYLSITIS